MAVASRRKIIGESIIAGLIGGAVFASAQALVASFQGLPPAAPWQYAASVATHTTAEFAPVTFTRFLIGAVIHFGFSAIFGAIFGLIVAAISRPVRNNLTLELAGGALYGLVLWLINVQLIGRLLFPWFLNLNPLLQAFLHAVCFGMPLATWLALRIRDVEVPGVHAKRQRYQTSTGDEELLRYEQWERNNEEAGHVLRGTRVPPPRGEDTGRTVH